MRACLNVGVDLLIPCNFVIKAAKWRKNILFNSVIVLESNWCLTVLWIHVANLWYVSYICALLQQYLCLHSCVTSIWKQRRTSAWYAFFLSFLLLPSFSPLSLSLSLSSPLPSSLSFSVSVCLSLCLSVFLMSPKWASMSLERTKRSLQDLTQWAVC